MRLTIQSTNLYVFNKNPLRTLRTVWYRVAPWVIDSAGIQEGGESIGQLKDLRLYKTYVRRGNRHTQNNPILLRKGLKFLARQWTPAAAGTGGKLTPPRNIQTVCYKKRGKKIAHINTHFHVVPEDKLAFRDEDEYARVGRQYQKHAELVKEMMLHFKKLGYIVFVTADGNTTPYSGPKEWKYSAYKYLDFKSFKVHRHGVDIIVYDTDEVTDVKFKVISKSVLGDADHDTVVLKAKVKK